MTKAATTESQWRSADRDTRELYCRAIIERCYLAALDPQPYTQFRKLRNAVFSFGRFTFMGKLLVISKANDVWCGVR